MDTPNASGRRARAADADALCLVHPAYEWQYAPLFQVLLAEFRRIGVRLTVRTGMFLDHRTEDIDLYFGRWSGNYPDPDAFMYGALHSDGGAYAEFTPYGALDAVAVRARSEADPSVRRALYVDLERMIREEAALLPLFYDRRTCFAGTRVRGSTTPSAPRRGSSTTPRCGSKSRPHPSPSPLRPPRRARPQAPHHALQECRLTRASLAAWVTFPLVRWRSART